MQAAHKFNFLQQTLWLSADRCIYWEDQKALIVSDLHFGKTGHFRKSGIGVPQNVFKEDLQRLVVLIQHYNPSQLIVVGDFFHSTHNKELDLFVRWRNDLPQLKIHLVKGNHDILKKDWYKNINIDVADTHLTIAPFCFVHDIAEKCEISEAVKYYFSGHIHPCITLNGLAKQSVKLPCFYFGKQFCVLPAFGRFTGTAQIEPSTGDDVFAILPGHANRGEKAMVMKVQ
ncbi:MAG: metallophosphoesterase [Segetibacter sp.]|nr:metallophosphoesterase [Segetibacter sp.]